MLYTQKYCLKKLTIISDQTSHKGLAVLSRPKPGKRASLRGSSKYGQAGVHKNNGRKLLQWADTATEKVALLHWWDPELDNSARLYKMSSNYASQMVPQINRCYPMKDFIDDTSWIGLGSLLVSSRAYITWSNKMGVLRAWSNYMGTPEPEVSHGHIKASSAASGWSSRAAPGIVHCNNANII